MSNKINQSKEMKNIVGKNMEQDKCLKKDSGKGQGIIGESAEREIEVEKQLKGGGVGMEYCRVEGLTNERP